MVRRQGVVRGLVTFAFLASTLAGVAKAQRVGPFASLASPLVVDSGRVTHRRATIVGGVVGAVVGGVTAAAYVLNATAYHCVTVIDPCPYDPHTARRVTTIAVGSVGSAALGAWIGRQIAT